jgi:hypothetical protein
VSATAQLGPLRAAISPDGMEDRHDRSGSYADAKWRTKPMQLFELLSTKT